MAVTLESANLVRQKTRMYTLDPFVFAALKGFFLRHSSKGNNDLKIIPVSDADFVTAGGTVLADAACTVYFIYLKKGTTATDAYVKFYANATDDTTAADERITLPILEASESVVLCSPQGLTFATGVVGTSHTTSNGTTDSTSGDVADGFLIVGATGTN